ncbi:MAG: RagB/SusD family nutrient uptake outer membrane protein [Bacteroidales bacterium]|nr:RagB/SusD family nutrient uptake outer membrane protein [Bacteroidales bacterium]
MKKIRIHLMALLAVLTTASCGFLDVDVHNVATLDNYYRTMDELEDALNGVYATLADNALYGEAMMGRLGLSADLGYEYYKKDAGTVSYYQASVSDTKINAFWRSLYAGIGRANLLLANIDRVTASDEALVRREQIRGEALFLRAYYYYMLVKRFDNVPLVLTPPSDVNSDEKYVAQSTPREVYNRILADMETAAGLVPDTPDVEGGWQVCRTAVWGMIARVALNMAGQPVCEESMYVKAATYAKMVIDSGYHGLNPDFEQIFINQCRNIYDIREVLFEVNFWGDNTGIWQTAGTVGRNIGIASSEESPIGYCMGLLRCNPLLWHLYDTADLRRNWTISTFRYQEDGSHVADGESTIISRKYCAKWRREYETSKEKSTTCTDINFPVLRYSDVLLMYAEAYAYHPSGLDRTLALECLNQVRRRGHGVDVSTPSAYDWTGDDEALRRELMDERARELAYEMLRKDDLVRWGVFYDRMQEALDNIDGRSSAYQQAAIAAYSSVRRRDVCWPIPAREISVNPLLNQNSGW